MGVLLVLSVWILVYQNLFLNNNSLNDISQESINNSFKNYYGKYVNTSDPNSYIEFSENDWKFVYKSCGKHHTYEKNESSDPDSERTSIEYKVFTPLPYDASTQYLTITFNSASQFIAGTLDGEISFRLNKTDNQLELDSYLRLPYKELEEDELNEYFANCKDESLNLGFF